MRRRPPERFIDQADAFSPVIDPDQVPDAEAATPEEKQAFRDPEETGS
jgi:hypothetical protein